MNSTAKIIEVLVSPDGQTTIQTKGFAGDGCRQASKALEQALGLAQREQLTPEFHHAAISQRQNTSAK